MADDAADISYAAVNQTRRQSGLLLAYSYIQTRIPTRLLSMNLLPRDEVYLSFYFPSSSVRRKAKLITSHAFYLGILGMCLELNGAMHLRIAPLSSKYVCACMFSASAIRSNEKLWGSVSSVRWVYYGHREIIDLGQIKHLSYRYYH